MDIQVLLLEDYGGTLRRGQQQAQIWRDLTAAYPWVAFRFDTCEALLTDDLGEGFWFDPEPQRKASPVIKTKHLKRDLLTGLAKALREVARARPQLVIGVGQGGTIALLLAKLRLCEAGLRNKVVQPGEMKSTGMAEAYQGIQAILVVVPQLFKARTSLKMLTDALPDLLKPGGIHPERSIDSFTLGWTYPRQDYEKLLGGLLGVIAVKGAESILLDALLRRRPLQINITTSVRVEKLPCCCPCVLPVRQWTWQTRSLNGQPQSRPQTMKSWRPLHIPKG